MTTTFNPYGGDANVHQVPVYEVPVAEKIGEKVQTHRVWYRWFQNLAPNIPYAACTVANLPAPPAGTYAYGMVTDATASTFYSTPTGGGAIAVPVYFDGTVWRIG